MWVQMDNCESVTDVKHLRAGTTDKPVVKKISKNDIKIGKQTCGIMFFSITSLKRGGGGKSSPSIKNGILLVSVTRPLCSVPPSAALP